MGSELENWLGQIRSRQAAVVDPPAVAEITAIWAGETEMLREGLTVHSLPLARFFGTASASLAGSLRDRWDMFRNAPRLDTLSKAFTQAADVKGPDGLPAFVETVFLQQIQRSGFAGDETLPPDHAQALASLFASVVLGEQAAVPHDERILPWLRGPMQAADAARGRAEDAFRDGDIAAAAAAAEQASTAYVGCRELADSVAQAFALRDRAWAQVPYLARWLTETPRAARRLRTDRGGSRDESHASDREPASLG